MVNLIQKTIRLLQLQGNFKTALLSFCKVECMRAYCPYPSLFDVLSKFLPEYNVTKYPDLLADVMDDPVIKHLIGMGCTIRSINGD